MCGIAGRYNYRSGAPVDPATLASICDLLAHRGPDSSGIHADGPLGLGHRRLAVIDLSEGGHQPMSVDGGVWGCLNGEIYNFHELRRDLQAAGHRFRSDSDTEVLLAAYRQWGLECLPRLRGMFAVAIWDAAARRLLLARDRAGKKPLYYWQHRHGLSFVSEPRALLGDPEFDVRPDAPALYHFLSLQYVPTPLSAFSGLERLPPGHYLCVEDGRVSVERYWKLRYTPKARLDEREALAELRIRLREAVRLRLISDVPLGAFLSGGIDSGVVVALMSEIAGRVSTFSIGFDEARYDELPDARRVAERYGTDHHEFVVRPDATRVLPKLVWHYSEPFADSSAVPTFYLSELARRSVTVALSGDGGDESFAGYDRYRAAVLAGRADRLPRWVRRAAGPLARHLPGKGTPAMGRARRFLDALPLDPERRYASWLLGFTDQTRRCLCTPEFVEAAGHADSTDFITQWYRQSDAGNFLDATLDADVNSYLPDDLLVKVDIASMAHGLEVRCPLLDHDVMEFAASLPPGLKLEGRTQKVLLRALARELGLESIVDKPKKGFGVPIDVWFREDLREMARDVLLGPRARQRGYFRPDVVERLLVEHASGARRWHAQLWVLLMFELWHRTFVDARTWDPLMLHAS